MKKGIFKSSVNIIRVVFVINRVTKSRKLSGVSNILAHLRATLEKEVVLGHTLNTLQHISTKKSHNVLSKFMILCWATFIAVLGCMLPTDHRMDTFASYEKMLSITSHQENANQNHNEISPHAW